LQAWTEKTIADLGRVVTGKTPPTGDSQYWNGDELFISPKDLEKDALYITSTAPTSIRDVHQFEFRFRQDGDHISALAHQPTNQFDYRK
jgi:hypothetical protein